jgi:hypothetical protein
MTADKVMRRLQSASGISMPLFHSVIVEDVLPPVPPAHDGRLVNFELSTVNPPRLPHVQDSTAAEEELITACGRFVT